jgi:hypothetical protein
VRDQASIEHRGNAPVPCWSIVHAPSPWPRQPPPRFHSRFRCEQIGPRRTRPNPSKHAQPDRTRPPFGDLITRRSRVRIPPPLYEKAPQIAGFSGFRVFSWFRHSRDFGGSYQFCGAGPSIGRRRAGGLARRDGVSTAPSAKPRSKVQDWPVLTSSWLAPQMAPAGHSSAATVRRGLRIPASAIRPPPATSAAAIAIATRKA